MDDILRAPAAQPTTTLTELVLAGHLTTPLALGVLDVADWVAQFPAFPISQELPTAGPAALPSPGFQPGAAIQFGSEPEIPRMLLRSPDARYSLQVQGDRFAVGWSRIEPVGRPAAYPGFDAMLSMWAEMSARFEAWSRRRFRSQPQYRLVEIAYLNAMPLQPDGQPKRRLSDVFRFVQPGVRPVNMFTVQWAERIGVERPNEPFGGVVNATVALSQAPPAIPVVAFNFTGLAAVAEGRVTEHIIRDVHAKIREIYQSAMIIDAH